MKDKQCARCRDWFPADLEHFYRQPMNRDGLFSYCKGCCKRSAVRQHRENKNQNRDPVKHKDDQRRWRRENPEQYRAIQLRRKYGLEVADFERMLTEQGGCCAICRRILDLSFQGHRGGRKKVHIDHCHSTGRVRGILCSDCNMGLGHFFDDTDVLAAAIAYLIRNRGSKEKNKK